MKDRGRLIIFQVGAALWGGPFCEWGRWRPPLFYSSQRGGTGQERKAWPFPFQILWVSWKLAWRRWVSSWWRPDGSAATRRPILRIRMDLPDSVPGKGGVGVDQCAQVSRELEPWLDAHPGVPERYVLEVSSPGVERPLTRPRDWERFKGNPVLVKGRDFPGGRGNRLEGRSVGIGGGRGGRGPGGPSSRRRRADSDSSGPDPEGPPDLSVGLKTDRRSAGVLGCQASRQDQEDENDQRWPDCSGISGYRRNEEPQPG